MTDDLPADRRPFSSLSEPAPPTVAGAASRRARWWLALSGILPLFGLRQTPPTTALIIYSCFVAVWFARAPLARVLSRVKSPRLAFVALMLAWGWIAELLAWSNEYLARDPHPALFHPQLAPDLLLVSGLFLGWAAAWLVAFRIAVYPLRVVFIANGLLGVVIEENGAVARAVLAALGTNPLQSLIMALYVLALYGAVPGLAMLGLEPRLATSTRRGWWRVPVAMALVFVSGKLGAWIIRVAADAAGLVPPPRPIWE